MANNIFAGRANVIIARASTQGVAVSSIFDATNLSIIFDMTNQQKSYIPGRAINQFTTFTADGTYYVVPKVDMDVSQYFAPPIILPTLTTTAAPTTTAIPTTASNTTLVTTTSDPNAPIRYATSQDLINISNASAGDLIVAAGNDSGGTNIIFRPSQTFASTQNFLLDCTSGSKKILIKGGNYDLVEIDFPGLTGTPTNPIIITNYGGQVKTKELRLKGLQYVKFTGKYDPVAKTGDPNFRGHNKLGGIDYADTAGTYGFFIDKQWLDISQNCISINGSTKLDGVTTVQASNIEMEYFEYGHGGFSFQVKDEVLTQLMDNMVFHDFYGHNTHGEGFYGGPTNGLPSRHQIKLHLYNARILRTGNDGLQAGQLAKGSIIENNVVHGSNNWKSCFDENQDASLQLGICDGSVIIRNNYFFGAGQQFINMQTDYQNFTTNDTGFIDIYNNSFQFCAGPRGAYIGQNVPLNAPIRLRNNLFSYFNYRYNQAYNNTNPNYAKSTHVVRIGNSEIFSHINNNIDNSDGHVNYLETAAVSPSSETGTTHNSVEYPPFLNYVPGMPSNYDWTGFGFWANKYFQTWGDEYNISSVTFQGQPVPYIVGDYVTHKSRFYKCIQNNNMVEPGAGVNWQSYWQLITFTNGSITPPDDVRMAFGSQHNTLGIGLLDNPTSAPTTAGPTTTAVPTTTTTTTSAPLQQNPDLNAYIWDNGDNTFTMKYERNRASLIVGTTVVALGSSTLAGNGSSSYATSLAGLLDNYLNTLTANLYVFSSNGVAGTDTRNCLPNGQDPNVTENKNISAAVAGKPSCILIYFPTNDINIGTAQEFTNRIVTIFNYARSYGIPCFVESPQPRNSFTSTMQQSLVDAWNLMKAAIPARFFIDVFQQLRDPAASTPAAILAQYAYTDGTHLNDAGHNVVFQATKNLIEAYFQDQGGQGYEIERSLSPSSGFTTYATIPSSSQVTWTSTRQDFQTYYYRVRAKLTSTPTYSGYSNVVSLAQPIAVSGVQQTIKLAFQPATDSSNNPTTVPAGWNNLTAVTVPSAGSTYSNIIDSTSATTSVVVNVTKAFAAVSFGGSPSASGYSGVGSGNWNLPGTQTSRAQLTLSGLSTSNVYNIDILCSRGTNNIMWYTCTQSGNAIGGSRVSNIDTSPQFSNIIHLNGLIPDNTGAIPIDVYGLGGGYINAMIIRKNNSVATTAGPTTTTTTAAPTTAGPTTTTTTAAPTTSLTRAAQVNIQAGTPSGLSGWYEWNIGAVEAYNITATNITDTTGAATPWGAILSGTYGTNDNGSTYGQGQSGLMCPYQILRFTSRITQTPTVLTITGLDNTKAYNIEVYISRNAATDLSEVVAIGTNTVTLQASLNYTNAALFNNVSPSGGQIVINQSRGATNPNFTYFNGFKIIELGANGTTTAAPTTAGPTTTAAGTTTAAPTTQAGTTGGPTTQIITSTTVNQTVKSFTVTAGGANPVSWNYCEKLPSDWVSNPSGTYPLIIFFVGLGEANTNTANIFSWGPSKFIKNGSWDGKVTVAGVTWDPIILTVQPTSQWPNTAYASDAVNKLIASYGSRVIVDRIYLTGLSMGGWMTSGIIMNDQTTCDKIAGWVNVEGVVPDDWGSNTQTPPYTNMQNCHRGRWLGFQQRDDYRRIDTLAATINSAALNAGKSPTEAVWYQTVFITSGTTVAGHGAFDEFYDPSKGADLPAVDGRSGENIYQWMLRQVRTAS